jgi:hypothetical protein
MMSLQGHGSGEPEKNSVRPPLDWQIRVSRPGILSFSLVTILYLSRSIYNTVESHDTRFLELQDYDS